MRSGGQLVVDHLRAQDVDRVFCVPGESYLAVLDALHDSGIDVVVARQEGGAAMMAEADGKITGRPGICLATRGPGATNAAAGVHIAKQDSTPMILLVGQIGRRMRGREAFQEVDYRQTFSDLAKWVEQIDHADRVPEVMSHAWHVAMSGRPGPVVLALPEDMLAEQAEAAVGPRVAPVDVGPTSAQMAAFDTLLRTAERPVMVLGGSRWSKAAVAKAQEFAARWDLPCGVSFRRQNLFDHAHPAYAGDVGLGVNPRLKARMAESDLVILLGARFSENPSQNFSLLDIPQPRQNLVHVHPGAEEIGRIYTPSLGICATPDAFLEATLRLPPPEAAQARTQVAHAEYLEWSGAKAATPGALQMSDVMAHLAEVAPEAVLTNGAGNYATWIHRFWRFRRFGAQIAPTSGSMGYGLPAAIAAKLRAPDQEVICFAGDGCFQMTCQEFGAAAQFGADVVVLVIDNQSYGTIRMHQEQRYPKRISATELRNPDFAAWAAAYGGYGETVTNAASFPAAFERARAHEGPALLHLKTDVEAITPTSTISALRSAARTP